MGKIQLQIITAVFVFALFLLPIIGLAEEMPLSPEEVHLEQPIIEKLHRQGSSLYIQSNSNWYRIAKNAEIRYCNQPSNLQMILETVGYPVELTINEENTITRLAIKCE